MVRRPAATRAVPGRPAARSRRRDDDGLSLVEVIVALFIVAVVMTTSALFFINGLKNSSLQVQRQTAVTLANQALEAVQAVKPSSLLKGRTANDVAALGTLPAGDLATGNVDTAVAPAAVAQDGPADDVVAANPAPTTVAGMQYQIKTFIDLCYVNTAADGKDTCTTAATPRSVFRATVNVAWTPKNVSCPGGCRYSASVLIDRQGDPQFNSNVSQPVIDAVSPDNALVSTTKTLTITGSGFVAGAVVAIEPGGGSMGPVTGNTGLQASAVWNVGNAAGSYLLSLTNPDGGRAFYALTVTPGLAITNISAAPVRALLTTNVTLTGTAFQPGATITMTGGTVTNAVFVSSTQITADVRPNGTQQSPATVTLTNPNGGGSTTAPLTLLPSQPTISTVAQSSTAAVNSPITITLTGTNFVPGAGVTSSSGTVSNPVTVTGSTAVSFTFTPNAANTSTTFTLTNPDGGQAAKAQIVNTSVAVPAPTLTAVSQGTPAPVGRATTVTLTGTNLAGASVSPSTGAVSGVTTTATTVQFTFTPSQANAATRFTVTNAGGSAFRDLTVQTTAAFAVTDYSATRPNNGNSNRLNITLAGTGFVSGGNIVAAWPGGSGGSAGSATAYNVVTPNSTSMSFTLDFPNGSFNKVVNFTITNGDGQQFVAQQQVVF